MDLTFNPFTNNFDFVGMSAGDLSTLDARYLKLDQTTYQTVINGAPAFNSGIARYQIFTYFV